MFYPNSLNKERPSWSNYLEFLFICLSYSLSMSMWTTPYLVYRNGGIIYLILMLVMYLIFGVPMIHFELVIGYLSKLSPLSSFSRMAPVFRGIGWAMAALCIVSSVYSLMPAWFLVYLLSSFRSRLDWALDCNHYYNTERCKTANENIDCFLFNGTKTPEWEEAKCGSDPWDTGIVQKSPAEEYFKNFIQRGGGGENIWPPVLPSSLGSPLWFTTLALLLVWVLTFLAIFPSNKCLRILGKLGYVFTGVPFVLLLILVLGMPISGQFLQTRTALQFYLTPNWNIGWRSIIDVLSRFIFVSGVGMGVYTSFSSHLDSTRLPGRTTLITVTPIFIVLASLLFQTLLGFPFLFAAAHLAAETDVEISSVIGAGLRDGVFVMFPAAVGLTTLGPFWAILWFCMFFMLSFGTQLLIVWNLVTSVTDYFPILKDFKWACLFRIILCSALFLFGLLFCTPEGRDIFTFVDNYAMVVPLFITLLFAFIAVNYTYGWYNVQRDLSLVFGMGRHWSWFRGFFGPASAYYTVAWLGILPNAVMFLIVWTIYDGIDPYNQTSVVDKVVEWICKTYSIVIIVLVAIGFIIYVLCRRQPFWRTLVSSSKDDRELTEEESIEYLPPGGNRKTCWCCCDYRISGIVVCVLEAVFLGISLTSSIVKSSSIVITLLVSGVLYLPQIIVLICLALGLKRFSPRLITPYLILQSVKIGLSALALSYIFISGTGGENWLMVLIVCILLLVFIVQAFFMSSVVGAHWQFRMMKHAGNHLSGLTVTNVTEMTYYPAK